MVSDKNWDSEAIESVRAIHHDPDFKGPNLSDKAEGTGMRVRLAGNVTGKQITLVLTLLGTLIGAWATLVNHTTKAAESTHSAGTPVNAAAIPTILPQIETQLAVHENRLNNVDRVLEQHQIHDNKIDDKLDLVMGQQTKILEAVSDVKVTVARLKPAQAVNSGNGGGSR